MADHLRHRKLVLEGVAQVALQEADWVTGGSVPDLFLLSDGAATWGESDVQAMSGILTKADNKTLFAYQLGATGTAIQTLPSGSATADVTPLSPTS